MNDHRKLWEGSADLAKECLDHPFVRGLADGTLPEEPFRRYVAQDGYFLNVFLQAYGSDHLIKIDAITDTVVRVYDGSDGLSHPHGVFIN